MTKTNSYQTPAEGTLDWHIPLNENFDDIETDVQRLADELGISDVGGYSRPPQGTLDWHIPLNENFDAIETDVQNLAEEVGISDVGGYNRPARGALDWHIPLNDNFSSIHDDLTSIANTVASASTFADRQTQTLSVGNIWRGLVSNYGTDDDTVVDITTYGGGDLGEKFDAAVSDAVESGTRPVFVIPPGEYTWATTVAFDTRDLNGPLLLASPDTNINVTVEWALDLSGYAGDLSPDVNAAFRLVGGAWAPTYGVLRQRNSFRGEFSPDTVSGGTTAFRLIRTGDEFCEGWTFRDTVYDGVSRPLEMDCTSADQQLLANLTFRDFDVGYNADLDSTTQNWAAVNCRFENPREGAVGMKTGNYCTGTIYAPVWTDGQGTLLDTNDSGTNPSIVDADVADGADVWSGQYGPAKQTSGQAWTQAQDTSIVTDGGPIHPTPVVRADTYNGTSLPERVEAAIADLTDDGTVLIPSGTHSWDSTLTVDTSDRDIAIVSTPNTRIDVSASGWAIDATGDGTIGIYGGDWRGDTDQSGFLTATATNVNVGVKQIKGWRDGIGVETAPATKGSLRIFDTKFHRIGGEQNKPNVRVAGAGVSTLALTTIEFSYCHVCIRLDAAVDDLEALRVSSHTYEAGSVFADTNAPVTGTWFNVKFESFDEPNQTVFDNGGSGTVGDVTEPIVYGGSEPVALWTGTEPRTFPVTGSRSATKFEP